MHTKIQTYLELFSINRTFFVSVKMDEHDYEPEKVLDVPIEHGARTMESTVQSVGKYSPNYDENDDNFNSQHEK